MPLVYFCLYLSPFIYLESPQFFSLYLFSRFYILLAILLSIKYLTLTYFPETIYAKDELRKLFTGVTPFHMLIPVSGILYPMLFKELGIILGYSRLSAWGNFYASGVGISMTIVYLFRHEYITY